MISGRLPSWVWAYEFNIVGTAFRTAEYDTRSGDGWVCMRILRDWLSADAFAPEGPGKGILEGRLDAIRYEGFSGFFLKG